MFLKIKNDILNILLLFVCFFIAMHFKQNTIELSLEVSMPEQQRMHQGGQLYYATGDGFSGKQNFAYRFKDYPASTFTLKAPIPYTQTLDEIRFDPLNSTGQLTLKKIHVKVGFFKQQISIDELYQTGNIFAMHSISDLKLSNHELTIYVEGNDPYLLIIKDIQRYIDIKQIWLFNAAISIGLALLGALLIHIYLFMVQRFSFLTGLPEKLLLFDIKHPQRLLFFSLILLALSILVVKTFTSLTASFHFDRNLSVTDYFFTYVTDLSLATVLGIAALGITLLSHLLDSEQFHRWISFLLTFSLKQLKNILNISLILVSIAIAILAIYYFVSAYIFYEWGGFVENRHLKMMGHAEVDSEIVDLVLSWRTLFFTLGFFALTYFSTKILRIININSPLKTIRLLIIILLPLGLLAWYPMNSHKFKPSVQSPVLMLQKQENSNEIPYKILKSINPDNFKAPASIAIPAEYLQYRSIAKGMNLIIVMMESVRKKNLELYGYQRKTMPVVNQLAKNSMVFHNAFVNQPRSSKTMESLSLGIYPDPRLEAISWKHKRLKVTDSFFKRFVDQGYLFYYGTMQKKKTTEGFYQFLDKVSGNHLDYITDLTDIYKTRPKEGRYPKERILNENLLQWTEKQQDPFVAFMWTQCAHMPYNSPITPFGTKTKVDKYDNCLANLDDGIGVLVEGLKKQNKLDNTLIMIAGDHGEALGEHLDWGHGNYLYDHSLRYPVVFYNPVIFKQQIDLYQRFQFKDLSATLLYLLGLPEPDSLGQSVNIFRKTATDKIYLSNVYLDYKLGLIYDHYKFVYRPKYNITYLYDLENDPNENTNIISTITEAENEALKREVLEWYKFQVNYVYANILEF